MHQSIIGSHPGLEPFPAIPNARCMPNSQRGFTLMEMVVVMLIAGLVSGLLFEGTAQLMGVQGRLEHQLTELRGEALRADWLRQVVQGLQPDYADGKQIFKGSPGGFSGLTTNPLSAAYGALQPFTVTLRRDAAHNSMLLGYGSGSNSSVLLTWPGDQGRLRYLDDRGNAHADWPPALGRWPQLPKGITLEGDRDGAPWLIATAPFGPTWPIPRPRDVMGARP